MRNTFFISGRWLSVSIALALLPLALNASNVLVQDTFSTSSERPENTSLEGTSPEQSAGHATWKAGLGTPTPYGILTKDGTLIARNSVRTGAAFPMEMRLAIAPVKSALTITASIVTKGSDWVGFGFIQSDSPGARSWFNPEDTLLWMMLRPNGSWTMYKNGTEGLLTSGTLKQYSGSESVTMGLEYDPQRQSARPFILTPHGEENLYRRNDGWIPTGLPADITIQAVGLRINPLPDGMSVAGDAFIDDLYVIEK